jgi:DNA-binding FadR family transcriptional regulator
MFQSVEQTPLYKLVARQIADLIATRKLLPESKMPPERELCESLNVSRATIREAMIVLEIAGFVENRFGAGMTVAAMPPARGLIEEVDGPGPFEQLEARLIVEGEIASMAAARATPEIISKLTALTGAMERETPDEFWGDNADEQFHLTIAQAAGNLALERALREFWTPRLRTPMWTTMHHRVPIAEMKSALVDDHRRIIAALAAGDGDRARAAMRAHIARFSRQLLELWDVSDSSSEQIAPRPSESFLRVIFENEMQPA